MKKEERQDSYSHILKYTGLFGGVQGLNILVGIVRTKFVALLLGPEGMGLLALFNSTIKLVSESTNLGLPVSAVREISDAYENGDQERLNHTVKLIRSWSVITALLGMLLCLLLSPWLDRWSFDWGNHTLHYAMLSPIIALMAVTGGELAVLKGVRQLHHLAALSVYNMLASLVITVPLIYLWGERAIIPSLFFVALVQMLLTIYCSYRQFPLHISFARPLLGEGVSMVKLGVAFVVAGIFGSGVDFIVRSYLNNAGSLDIVGMFNAGYMMTMTYGGLVFSAMETDYFPRLSAVNELGARLNETVNKQIEVSILLLSPMLMAFMVGLPILVPLLYSKAFMGVVGMAQVLVFAMFIRAITLPIEYLPLARGDSGSFLLMETLYDIMVVGLVIACFRLWGLTGTGVALVVAGVMNLCMVLIYMRYKYNYVLSGTVVKYALMHLPLLAGAYLATSLEVNWMYWVAGMLLVVLSLCISLQVLHTKARLWDSLKKKWRERWQR